MNVIFLGINGVLNSNQFFKKQKENGFKQYKIISDYHLQILGEICEKCNAKVVLCSILNQIDNNSNNRDENRVWNELKTGFEKYKIECIGHTQGINKPYEINKWLKDTNNVVKYIIIDDSYGINDYKKYNISNKMIRTVYWDSKDMIGGLQQKHIDRAIDMFNRQ